METVPAGGHPSLDARAREPMRYGPLLLLVPIGVLVILGLPLALRTLLVEAFEIEGPAMEPTVLANERIALDKTAYGVTLPFAGKQAIQFRLPEVGDVVVLRSPTDDMDIFKRVVGVPGDLIEGRELDVLRNGKTLTTAEVPCPPMQAGPKQRRCFRERLGAHEYTVAYSRALFGAPPVVVPDGHVFVMGDHRSNSNDSRNPAIGPVDGTLVKGQAARIYWSENLERLFKVIE